MTQWTVKSGEDLGRVLAFLAQSEPPYTITFKAGEEKRRDAQNRFIYEAYDQIAKMLGDRTASDVRAETKLHCGIPIMRNENDAFREKYDRLLKPFPYETKLELMVEPMEFPVTSLMNVKQMSRYITDMMAYWDSNGASVMLPDFER